MRVYPFLLRLAVVIYLCSVAALTISQISEVEGVIYLMVMTLSFYSLLCITMYLGGRYLISNTRKNIYLGMVMFNVFVKMICSVLIIYIYHLKYDPIQNHYLIPFIISYLLFTIFETHFMMKQSDAENIKFKVKQEDY